MKQSDYSSYKGIKYLADRIKNFYRENTVKILVCILGILILLLIAALIVSAVKINEAANAELTLEQQYMEKIENNGIALNNDTAISNLFERYYTALPEGDTDTILDLFNSPDLSDLPMSLDGFVSAMEVEEIYVTRGLLSDELAAVVIYNACFEETTEKAVCYDTFYLKKDNASGVYLLYSEMRKDYNRSTYMKMALSVSPVREKIEEVNERLEEAFNADSLLKANYDKMTLIINRAYEN